MIQNRKEKENKEEDIRYAKQIEDSRLHALETYPIVEKILNELFDEVLRDDEAQWYGKSGFSVMCYSKERDYSLLITQADERFQISARKGHYIINDRNVFVMEHQDNLLIIKFPDFMKMKNEYTRDRCFEIFIRKFVKIFGR